MQSADLAAITFPSCTLRYSTRPVARTHDRAVVPRLAATHEEHNIPYQSMKPVSFPFKTEAMKVLNQTRARIMLLASHISQQLN